MAKKMKPFHLFVPITRVNAAERIVEGYAFVNETVPGEGGVRLLRSAMEAATTDYMRWGALREMHQPSAVGTAQSVEWDDKGAFFRAKVVDDRAWQKVQEGVYKGFSVGVIPRVMRGSDVTTACWAENSLVDRPKDEDCPLTFRSETFDADAEVDVEEQEPEADPATDPAEPPTDLPAESAPLEAALQPLLTRLEATETRLATLETERQALLIRAETAETNLAAATERVQVLERTPAGAPPVRFPAALERTFLANGRETEKQTELTTELRGLEESIPKEPDEKKRQAGIARMQVLKFQLEGRH